MRLNEEFEELEMRSSEAGEGDGCAVVATSDPYCEGSPCMPEEDFREDSLPSAGAAMPRSMCYSGGEKIEKFPNLCALGNALVSGFREKSSEGAFSAFAKLLAPLGAKTPSDGKQTRWGIFPLPVDFEGDSLRYTQATEGDGARDWLRLAALALNSLNGEKGPIPSERKSKQVSNVLKSLHERIGRFLSCCKGEFLDPEAVWEDIKTKKLSYEGEEISKPHPLTLEQIQKSVPPLGHGGVVALSPLLHGHARFLIE